MKNINECFNRSQSLSDYVNTRSLQEHVRFDDSERVDEGLKEVIGYLKSKFKVVASVFGKLLAKVGNFFVSLTEDGIVLPVVPPVNAGVAYRTGQVNKSNTLVVLPKEEAKLAGISTSIDSAFKLYGSGNSLKYWKQLSAQFHESLDDDSKMINEVKLEAEDPEAKYNRVCDGDELAKIIKEHINNKQLARLLIWGAPGIGKTAILAAIVNEIKASSGKDFRCIVKTLSNETPDNFMLPAYSDDVEQVSDEEFSSLATKLGKEPSTLSKLMRKLTRRATDIPKTWLPVYQPSGDKVIDAELDERCGRGLLFIDELSRATPQVLNVILPLINEGNFNGYRLGSGWTIIAASNRMEDEMSGQAELGTALSNRFAHVYFEPTVYSWRQWAETQGYISPLILSWLSLPGKENLSGGGFYYMDPNENDPDHPTQLMCTPRSWTNAMRALAVYHHTGKLEGFSIFDIDENTIKRVLNRYVPASAIDSFMAFLKVVREIGGGSSFESAINGIWKKGTAKGITKKSAALISIALAQLIVTSHHDDLPTTEEFVNLANFLVSTDSDQLASCVLDVFCNVFFGAQTELQKRPYLAYHLFANVFDKKGDKVSRDVLDKKILALINKHGYAITLDEYPDYSKGLKILADKFGERFKAAIVDGQEALG